MRQYHRILPGLIATVAALLVMTHPIATQAAPEWVPGEAKPFVIKGRVTVQFEPGVDATAYSKSFQTVNFDIPSLDRILSTYQVYDARRVFKGKLAGTGSSPQGRDLKRFFELRFPTSINVETVVEALRQNPNITIAEPVWALPFHDRRTPNDDSLLVQWALDQESDEDIDALEAWDIETGKTFVILAMIDSGVHYRHRDLKSSIWVNPGEDLDGDRVVFDADDMDRTDNDGNDYPDDVIGYDFFTGIGIPVWEGEDGSVPDSCPMDFAGHGTHCAGSAAAVTNNYYDVAGIAGGWNGDHRSFAGVKIMCCRVGALADDGIGYVNTNDCAEAIVYAAENGAHVINCSWGMSYTSPWNAAMSAVATYGVTIVHSAGNDGVEQSEWMDSDPYTDVLTVAALNRSGIKWSGSNYGPWVDLSAPGVDIMSTDADGPGGYPGPPTPTVGEATGTSMAAPIVCGAALLVRSAKPSLTKEQVDSILEATTDDIYPQNPTYLGKLGTGRVNAYSALAGLPIAKYDVDVADGNIPLEVSFTDMSPDSPNWWEWHFGTGDISHEQNPTYTYMDAGLYDVSLYVDWPSKHALGYGEEVLQDYIWVRADTARIDSMEVGNGQPISIPLYLHNTQLVKDIQFAFQLDAPGGVQLTGASKGPRTEYFHSLELNSYDPPRYSFLLRSSASDASNYLPEGSGIVLYLELNIAGGVEGLITIDTATVQGRYPKVGTIFGDYWPVFAPGKISVVDQSCCNHDGMRGDVNYDMNGPNIVDLTFLVAYLFGSGDVPPCLEEADINGSGSPENPEVNIVDLTYLSSHLFGGGPPPAACP